MYSPSVVVKASSIVTRKNIVELAKVQLFSVRHEHEEKPKGCTKAKVDLPKAKECDRPCDRPMKKTSILHKIKLKFIEGGTNFGTPFRRLQCKEKKPDDCKAEKPKALPAPKEVVKKKVKIPERPGVQVSVLGADTSVGQYVALLLKQCPCIKKLRLYEAKEANNCGRNLCRVAEDLHLIDTNCHVQAFPTGSFELERCLQSTDIVLILESSYVTTEMDLERRFSYQAPLIKKYADVIATECPKAFVIVCASPIDCMVPLIAETLKESGWYDPRKLLGSLAVPEMRASTIAAKALGLEPRYTRVPCVGGTEGASLVPLFSRAVEYFDFTRANSELLTAAVRAAPAAVARTEGDCPKGAEMSEAHALANLVKKVAFGLLCQDIPRLTGFVETDARHVISPARYMSVELLVNKKGICRQYEIPRLCNYELDLMDVALQHIAADVNLAVTYYKDLLKTEHQQRGMARLEDFLYPKHYEHVDSCQMHLV